MADPQGPSRESDDEPAEAPTDTPPEPTNDTEERYGPDESPS